MLKNTYFLSKNIGFIIEYLYKNLLCIKNHLVEVYFAFGTGLNTPTTTA